MRKTDDRIKKREFKAVVAKTVYKCLDIFGYTKPPYVLETKLRQGVMMRFGWGYPNGNSVIEFDYGQFTHRFKKWSKKDGKALAAYMTAHEMRHYYQFRQLSSSSPTETPKIIAEWKSNEPLRDRKIKSNYYADPRELDAFMFAYIYVAENYNTLPGYIGVPEHYRKMMAKYCKRIYGKRHRVFARKLDKYFF